MPVAAGKPRPTHIDTKHDASVPGPKTPRTPKTPQDEAIAFFSGGNDGVPVQVWELELEDDGGPGPGKDVSSERARASEILDSRFDCVIPL